MHWWSRPYEYAWASQFAESEDIVLDAACGICHPLKFYLLDNCRKVYACDIDKRILSPEEILKDIADDFGEETATHFPQKYLKNIHYTKAPLTALPYEDKTFNKIYCISVLEHLDEPFNKYLNMVNMDLFNRLFLRNMRLSLKEFERTLKDDGLIILTFDYPTVNLKYLTKTLLDIGLVFADNISFEISENAVYSQKNELYCFRAILKKKPKTFK